MAGKCKLAHCVAPISCHEHGGDHKTCEHWEEDTATVTPKKETSKKDLKTSNLSWSGEPLKFDNVDFISARGNPLTIGIVGKADAGKTTFLAMLYTLLLNGKQLKSHRFAGSKTIIGWDRLYWKLKLQKEKVAFPDPTATDYYRLFHLALRNSSGLLRDVLISEASGEVFYNWSQNRNHPLAENARKIYETSEAFVFFIDCKDLIARKGSAKADIIDIAQMLKHDLRGRPVIFVWSKSDEKEKVHPTVLNSLVEELKTHYQDFYDLDISNFPVDNPDVLVHENNLKVLDWLLEKVTTPVNHSVIVKPLQSDDLFLNYRGK